ncbi:MAG: hypothetical protein Kow0077_19330 [Anaerolineae bacterium]
MSERQRLQPVNTSGWAIGFGNLLRKELSAWWRFPSWLIQAVIWLAIINGMVGLILWMAPAEATASTDAVEVFFGISGIAASIGIIIVMQGAIMDERLSGTLEWLLSKPVARPAVILTKLLANAIGALLIMVVLQGAVAYLQFTLAGKSLSVAAFITGLGLLYLYLLFFLALTLLMGVVFKHRGAVFGIPIGLVFGYQIILGILPGLAPYTPWALIMPVSMELNGMAAMVALGAPLPTISPVIATLALIAIMIGLAIWRFEQMEF